jgi:hypothetical protein
MLSKKPSVGHDDAYTAAQQRGTRSSIRAAVTTFVVLFMAVAAIASSSASAAATVQAGTFVLPIETFLPCGVGGETIHLVGTARYHFAFVFDASAGSHLVYGAEESLLGTGLTAGLSYRLPGTFMDSIQLTSGGVQVITHITDARLTGPNGGAVSVVRSVHITVDGNTVRELDVQFFCA